MSEVCLRIERDSTRLLDQDVRYLIIVSSHPHILCDVEFTPRGPISKCASRPQYFTLLQHAPGRPLAMIQTEHAYYTLYW